jgi:hypothetical protein
MARRRFPQNQRLSLNSSITSPLLSFLFSLHYWYHTSPPLDIPFLLSMCLPTLYPINDCVCRPFTHDSSLQMLTLCSTFSSYARTP